MQKKIAKRIYKNTESIRLIQKESGDMQWRKEVQ